jgi:hypothetical protein
MIETKSIWSILHDTAIWWSPIVAGFIGAFGVHLLSQSRELEAWVRNCQKEEWKELLSTLTKAELALANLAAGLRSELLPDYATGVIEEYKTAVNDAYRTLHDRLFIQAALEKHNLPEQWDAIRTGIHDLIHSEVFVQESLISYSGEFGRIKRLMRNVALEQTAPKSFGQRLIFWRD